MADPMQHFLSFSSAAAQIWATIVIFYVAFSKDALKNGETQMLALWNEWSEGMYSLHGVATMRIANAAMGACSDEELKRGKARKERLQAALSAAELDDAGLFLGTRDSPKDFARLARKLSAAQFFVTFRAGETPFRSGDDDDLRVFPDSLKAQHRIDGAVRALDRGNSVSPQRAIFIGIFMAALNLFAIALSLVEVVNVGYLLFMLVVLNFLAGGAMTNDLWLAFASETNTLADNDDE